MLARGGTVEWMVPLAADIMLVLVGGGCAFFLVFVVLLGMYHPRQANAIVGRSLRNPAADAEIEANDIEMMIEAQNEMRRRRGAPDIGDELAEQLKPHLRDG
jgi:hypothetical protein